MQEKYKKLFFIEAKEKIEQLNKALLELEKKPGQIRFANEAMRAAHTLKSSAAAMNFMEISHLAHTMEDFFEEVRTKKHRLKPEIIQILFKSVDALGSALKLVKKGQEEPKTALFIENLKNLRDGKKVREVLEGAALAQKPEAIAPIEEIKVDTDTIDNLMNLTEELLVEKMRLNEIVKQLDTGTEQKKNLAQLKVSNDSFNRLISELQYNVTQARMLPLGQIFERFPRMVRDLVKQENKEVDFKIEGQEIELDRTVIDRIGEPIIHLLRNAIDHGIVQKGKVALRALRERDKVIIEVENDGKTIDWQAVKQAAKKRGITISGEIEDILYHPQLSTKKKVTETSGRGIGLNIVKSVIESLGGNVSFQSPIEGQKGGTKFSLELPLTLAIIQALLVRVVNQIFALPFSQIDRSVRVSVKSIKKALDQEVAVVGEEDIPIVRLDKLFGIKRKESGLLLSEEELQEKRHLLKAELIVITRKENLPDGKAGLSSAGLIIDELISEQDIVVKPLKGILKKTKGIAGITLLGDGRPALILDVATLI